MRRLILRLRWLIAAPILRPMIAEWERDAELASRSAKNSANCREWQIECIARSELMHVHATEIEQAFGCASFDEKHHYVRHYR